MSNPARPATREELRRGGPAAWEELTIELLQRGGPLPRPLVGVLLEALGFARLPAVRSSSC
jgi:hypothetical protein